MEAFFNKQLESDRINARNKLEDKEDKFNKFRMKT